MDDAPLSTAATPSPTARAAHPETQLSTTSFLKWVQRHPLDFGLNAGIFALVIGFFSFYPAFGNGSVSAFKWLWYAWNPQVDFEHGRLSPIIFAVLLYLIKDKLWAAPKSFCAWGIPILAGGIILFLLSVRMLQPRVAIASLPPIILGISLIIWGKPSTRVLLFPACFLYILIPIPGIEQATASLQLVISKIVAGLSGVFGVDVEAIGSTLHAAGNNGFTFEIAGGCSGVRSLMAMTMITALYVHFTQKEIWKKVVIFGASLGFAVLGNIARVTSIIMLAKFGFRDIAIGTYHDNASLILFFPFALLAMLGFAHLLNLNWPKIIRRLTTRESASPLPVSTTASPGQTTDPRPDRY